MTVITRTRDRHLLLARALKSVQEQNFRAWEHLIINDGGEAAALDAFLAPHLQAHPDRLHVHHLSPGRGMQPAANFGLEQAKREFVIIHDDDDAWHPDFLAKAVALLDEQGPESLYQGVVCQTERVWESIEPPAEGQQTITELSREAYVPLGEISLFRLGFENPFPPIAFLYRRRVLDEIGPYDPKFHVAADMDFNFRFLRRYEIAVLPEVLAYYHHRKDPDSPHANSVVAANAEHKRRANEFKNHYLRGEDPKTPLELGLALNMAQFLVEGQWKTEASYQTLRRLDTRILKLFEDLTGDAYSDRFASLREALAIIIDHLRSPHLQDKLNALADSLGESHESLAKQLGEAHQLLAKQLSNASQNLETNLTDSTQYLGSQITDAREDVNTRLDNSRTDLASRLDATRAELADHLRHLRPVIEEELRWRTSRTMELVEQLQQTTSERVVSRLDQLQGQLAQQRDWVECQFEQQRERIDILLREAEQAGRDQLLIKIGPLRLSWRRKKPRKFLPEPPPDPESSA